VGRGILVTGLAVALVVASLGWFLSARDGKGIPLDCYVVKGTTLTVAPTHGSDTLRATFSVSEEENRVVVGYWEEVEGGAHTAEAYLSELSYGLVTPLGRRTVVDPSGAPIAPCGANH
jgi:hypothetical protein